MKHLTAFALGLALIATAAAPALAHSLKELESQLHDRERYFQPMDRPAPAFSLQNSEGRTVSLGDFRNKVVVLHFVYTHCPDLCPLHAEKIAEIQRMVNQTPMRDQVRFVTITTDPERDTADVMRAFGSAHGLDPVNWTFLTSGPERPEKTRRLAKDFGHVFSPAPDGTQAHGIVTHIIDREGRLRANFHGLEFDPANLIVFVNALVNDVHKPGDVHEPELSQQPPSLWDRLKAMF